MPRISPEGVQLRLDELSSQLLVMGVGEETPPDALQAEDDWQQLTETARLMDEVIRIVQPEQRIQLIVGKTAITAHNFRRNAAGLYFTTKTRLGAGETRRLDKTIVSAPPEQRLQPSIFVGGTVLFKLRTVAATIQNGGLLRVVDHRGDRRRPQ